jgi:DNA-binding MarR family transcriptional regulator
MDAELVARFRRAYWRAFRELDTVRLQQWERSRITLPQLRVLHHLRRNPDTTTLELSRALGITVSTTSGLVIKLVDAGLIERGRDPQDRRREPLRLSEQGSAALVELRGAGRAFLDEVAGQLGERLEPFTEMLEQLSEAAVSSQPESQSEQASELSKVAPR